MVPNSRLLEDALLWEVDLEVDPLRVCIAVLWPTWRPERAPAVDGRRWTREIVHVAPGYWRSAGLTAADFFDVFSLRGVLACSTSQCCS